MKNINSEIDQTPMPDILKSKGFNAYEIQTNSKIIKSYNRKDFYKISLITGELHVEYADRSIQTQGTTLFFATSHIPYSCEIISKEYNGYACLFTEEFLKTNNTSESLQQSPLFKIGGTPVFDLNEEQARFAKDIFRRILIEHETEYLFKNDLIRNFINVLIHEALKLQPSENFVKHKNGSARVVASFLELLEKQFPIDTPEHPLTLKSAVDYAECLGIHVNHLNHAVRKVTGKTTTAHISERIITEAKALLKHTDWSISEVAFALGFEYLTYFNNYFKRHTNTTPSAFR